MKTLWFVFSFLLLPHTVFGAGFSVTPMLQEVILDNSAEEVGSVVIANETTDSVTFDVSTIDFKGLDQSGGVAFLGATGITESYSLSAWMEPDTLQLTLAPNESRTVQVTFRNDETLSPGGHYGALIFKQAVGEDTLDKPKVALQQLFTSLFFVKKIGGAKYGMELDQWETKRNVFELFTAQDLTFRATGNVHVVPRGEIRVVDPIGRPVAKGSINEASALVLPETVRSYQTKLTPLETLWIPGMYQLTLQYRYDGKMEVETREKSVWLVPPRSLIVFIGLMVFFVGMRVFGRRFRGIGSNI